MHAHSNTNKQVVFRKVQVDIHVYHFPVTNTRIEANLESMSKASFAVAIETFLGVR